jgi:hypothetical protein
VISKTVSPGFLTRKWPPALTEWSTRAVRDVFFQSADFPRLLQPEAVRDVIARGVNSGDVALVTRTRDGGYNSFKWKVSLTPAEVDIDEGTFIIQGDVAQRHVDALRKPEPVPVTAATPATPDRPAPGLGAPPAATSDPPPTGEVEQQVATLQWTGEVPPLLWGRVYTKVLNPHVQSGGLTLQLTLRLSPPGGLSPLQVSELRHQLQALGLSGDFDLEP